MKSSLVLVILLLMAASASAETIRGEGCFRFSEGESLATARDVAFILAERDALEAYTVFAQAIAAVQDPTLRSEFIASLGPGLLRNIQVTSELVRYDSREVCRVIEARIEAAETIAHVVAKMNAPHQAPLMPYGWYPENDLVRVLETVNYHRGRENRIVLVFECKRDTEAARPFQLQLKWIDSSGLPGDMEIGAGSCRVRDAVGAIDLAVPPWNYKYWIELPQKARDVVSSSAR